MTCGVRISKVEENYIVDDNIFRKFTNIGTHVARRKKSAANAICSMIILCINTIPFSEVF